MKHWAMNHDVCASCGSSKTPHHAKGLCHNCYHKQYQRKQRSTDCPRCPGKYELGHTVGRDQVAAAITDILEEHGVECYVHTDSLYLRSPSLSRKVKLSDYTT